MSRTKLTSHGVTVNGALSMFCGFVNFIPETDGFLSITSKLEHYKNLSVINSWKQPEYYSEYDEVISMSINDLPIKPMATIYVNGNGKRDFTTIKDAIDYVNNHKKIQFTVYVEKGTYDLISEFGDDYFTNLGSGGCPGLQLSNNVHIIFSPGSKVICHYTGDNYNVRYYFSPFNTPPNMSTGFIIENLNLECSGTRYAIHDDSWGQDQFYRNVYRNCNISLDNTSNTDGFHACIGGGLGTNTEIVIENCHFKSNSHLNGQSKDVVSYHNCSGDGKSKIFISGCYFERDGTVRVGSYGSSTDITITQITNCSMGSAPIEKMEDSNSTIENMKILTFNNEIRQTE